MSFKIYQWKIKKIIKLYNNKNQKFKNCKINLKKVKKMQLKIQFKLQR